MTFFIVIHPSPMYSLINKSNFLSLQDASKLKKHFTDYLFCLDKKNLSDMETYKQKYKAFWAMNAARNLANNDAFYKKYFAFIEDTSTNIADYKQILEAIEKTNAGFQFSFATKAAHVLNPDLPIYDVNIQRFYFFKQIESDKKWEDKIEIADKYYKFLKEEYNRIIEQELLLPSLHKLDEILASFEISPNYISQTKKIDSIIWLWVDYLNKGGITGKEVIWQ